MKFLFLGVLILAALSILAVSPPARRISPADRLSWEILILEQMRRGREEWKRAEQRAAAYEEWKWWAAYNHFALKHNQFTQAVEALTAEREKGILDAQQAKARIAERQHQAMEEAWKDWRKCQGWPVEEKRR
jgi:hypothetical protein